MKNGLGTAIGASVDSKEARGASRTGTVAEPPYRPLDIDDPEGRFGKWMPGDDPDDWR